VAAFHGAQIRDVTEKNWQARFSANQMMAWASTDRVRQLWVGVVSYYLREKMESMVFNFTGCVGRVATDTLGMAMLASFSWPGTVLLVDDQPNNLHGRLIRELLDGVDNPTPVYTSVAGMLAAPLPALGITPPPAQQKGLRQHPDGKKRGSRASFFLIQDLPFFPCICTPLSP
jgi:hypothetical protein